MAVLTFFFPSGQFLSLLKEVSHETLSNEPDCLAYFWLLPSTKETKLQGLEIYRNEHALSQTHRNGEAYRRFRKSLIEEGLALPPTASDLLPGQLVNNHSLWPKEGNESKEESGYVALVPPLCVSKTTYTRSPEFWDTLEKAKQQPVEEGRIATIVCDGKEKGEVLVVEIFRSRENGCKARTSSTCLQR